MQAALISCLFWNKPPDFTIIFQNIHNFQLVFKKKWEYDGEGNQSQVHENIRG